MSKHDDKIFIQHFSAIIAGLVVFTVVIALLAAHIHGRLKPSDNPSEQARVEDRLKPVAGVYAGEAGQAALLEASAAAAAAAPAAFDGSTDGQMIYTNVCAACHMSGAAGAPQLVAEAWGERLDKGVDELSASAINGIGLMPAKGGRSDLSDEQVHAAVEYMLAEIGN